MKQEESLLQERKKLSGRLGDIECDLDELEGEKGVAESRIDDIDCELKELQEEREMFKYEPGHFLRHCFRELCKKIDAIQRDKKLKGNYGSETEVDLRAERRDVVVEMLLVEKELGFTDFEMVKEKRENG